MGTEGNTADTLNGLLTSLAGQFNLKNVDLAKRFGVSPKTITRYLMGRAMPPVRSRLGMVHALADLDSPLVPRIAEILGVSHAFPSGAPRRPVDPAVTQRVSEDALTELLHHLDVGPVRGRAAAARFLGRLADAHVDPGAARDALTR